MQRDKLIELVKKLMRLAERAGTPAEAAAAAARATDLLGKYRVQGLELEAGNETEADEIVEGDDVLGCKTRVPEWRAELVYSLARANNCQAVCFPGKGRMRVYGRSSDEQAVRYLYQVLCKEIERLAEEGWEAALGSIHEPARTWKNSFRLGAVREVRRRLREAKAGFDAAMPSSTTALVHRLENSVAAFVKSKVGPTTTHHGSGSTVSRGAYEQGAAAGAGVCLGGGRGLKRPALQLPPTSCL